MPLLGLLRFLWGGHTYCAVGRKTALENLAGTKMGPKLPGGQNLTFKKTHSRATLTLNIPLSTIIYSKPY